jgi:LPS export ABC transporter protein LptC/lipopolysaccharide transport protein LptA
MRWQRWVRIVMVVLVAATLIGIFMSVRKPGRKGTDSLVQRADPQAMIETKTGRVSQATGLKVPGFIDFEGMLTYPDGTMKFSKFKLTTDRSGRKFYMGADEGVIGKDQSHMEAKGRVVLENDEGLHVTTDEATYSSGEEIVRAPHKVEFTKGSMSGSGVGMTYDKKRDVLWLLDQAVINVAPDKKTEDPGAKILAGAFGYARREKYMRFERTVNVVRGDRTISGDTAMAYLTDDEKAIKSLELRGNSRIAMAEPAEGGLQAMGSRDMNINFADDGETIQHAVLVGGSAIQMAGSQGKPGRRISGEVVDVALGEDSAVTGLLARQNVQLTIPPDGANPERTIQSEIMEGKGEPGKGLTGATFRHRVEFREARQPNPRLAHASILTAVLTPDGGLDDARFGGGTHFVDGTTNAAAADARYLVTKGHLELSGKIGPLPPQVQDERITVVATNIDLTFDGPKMLANGDVQSVMKPSKNTADAPGAKGAKGAKSAPGAGAQATAPATGAKSQASKSAKPEPKTPGMLKDDQPAYVTANALNYDGDADKAIYTGSSRLWQGDTAVSADTITIDEKTGDLLASRNVRSTQVMQQNDEQSKEPKKVPTIATADDMHYEDALHRNTYTTNAHMIGQTGDLRASKIELYLAEDGGTLERAEAYEKVNLKTDIRTSTGDRLTYFAADDRYFMRGKPVVVIENCKQSTGKSCTFWRTTDRILMDGEELSRTLATNTNKTCVPVATAAPAQGAAPLPTTSPSVTTSPPK